MQRRVVNSPTLCLPPELAPATHQTSSAGPSVHGTLAMDSVTQRAAPLVDMGAASTK